MSYSNVVRFLGIGAVVAGLVATVLLLIGAFREGAVLALLCIACAVCLTLVMVRHQAWASATTLRSLGRRLDATKDELSGLGTNIMEQAVLLRTLEERTVLLRDLETRLSTLDSVPESFHAVSGVVAETRSAVLENTTSLRSVERGTEQIRESLDLLSMTADTITVGVSALRSATSARPAVQKDPVGAVPDKAPAARPIPNVEGTVAGGRGAEMSGLLDGPSRVLALGIDLLETEIDGQWTVPLLPGSIPSRASLPASVVIVIDESGFSRGVWKSFGGSYDGYLLSELEAVRRLSEGGRGNVITLISEDAPEPFRTTRNWGVVASNPAEVGQILRAATRR